MDVVPRFRGSIVVQLADELNLQQNPRWLSTIKTCSIEAESGFRAFLVGHNYDVSFIICQKWNPNKQNSNQKGCFKKPTAEDCGLEEF